MAVLCMERVEIMKSYHTAEFLSCWAAKSIINQC